VWSAATLAPSFSALEADVATQLAPVRGIERSQLRANWHRYAVSWVIAAYWPSDREGVHFGQAEKPKKIQWRGNFVVGRAPRHSSHFTNRW